MAVNVLVVDDSKLMRSMIKRILTPNGYNVVDEAKNGLEAIEKYKQHRPDVVTLDVTMAEMDGLTALKEIKAFDPNAKVIMCSAMGQKYIVLEALKEGAVDFVVKPFEDEKVLEAVRRCL